MVPSPCKHGGSLPSYHCVFDLTGRLWNFLFAPPDSPPLGYFRQENTGREELTENAKGPVGRRISAIRARPELSRVWLVPWYLWCGCSLRSCLVTRYCQELRSSANVTVQSRGPATLSIMSWMFASRKLTWHGVQTYSMSMCRLLSSAYDGNMTRMPHNAKLFMSISVWDVQIQINHLPLLCTPNEKINNYPRPIMCNSVITVYLFGITAYVL